MSKRIQFSERITEWLGSRAYTTNECHPFEDISGLTKDMESTFKEWGIVWIGSERFGETITFGGEWIDEGVALEININPTITGEGFRTLIRWR